LQDGAALEDARAQSSADEFKTLVLPEGAGGGRELPPTEVLNPEAQQTARPRQPSPTAPHSPRDTSPVTGQANTGGAQSRSPAAIVGLTVIATIALLALGGLSAWLLLRDRSADSAQRNDGALNVNAPRSINQNNAQPNSNAPPNSNARPPSNANVTTLPSPTPATTPASTPAPNTNPSVEETQVRAALSGWLSSFRARDIDEYMAHYAGVLDVYYLAHNASVARVRVDKERAFTKYSTIDVSLSNVRVQVEPSGQRAVATFTKTYRLSGPGVNTFEGSGLNRFTFTKVGGRWLITGEEDIT
jgi:cell division septation protein DedD